ncbi:MAG TPA: L,D-transpeptidase [Beijerinckiaceae bacterium]|nr:L,D-transpeptidase [Beijerinckiaceae bacterium]
MLAVVSLCAGIACAAAQGLTADAVNNATFSADARNAKTGAKVGKGPSPALVKAQVLLDRSRFSPGMIDGRTGDNLRKALAAFAQEHGVKAAGELNQDVWTKLTESSGEPAVIEYTISDADVKGPFAEKIPARMEDMAKLDRLGYTSAQELLAEKFHASADLLTALNPGKRFDEAGTRIVVPNVLASQGEKSDKSDKGNVARIEVEKGARALKVLDKGGKLLAFYPASIGSTDKPAPSGDFTVRAVAENPTYTYDPKFGFKGVKAKEKLTIKPGPNNPVGAVWIDLSLETYGIHGTPEPEKVGKSFSHGCVRLTNWDAKELAAMVQKGTKVTFVE